MRLALHGKLPSFILPYPIKAASFTMSLFFFLWMFAKFAKKPGTQSCQGHGSSCCPTLWLVKKGARVGLPGVTRSYQHTHKHTPNTPQASPDSPLFVTVGLLTSTPAIPIFLLASLPPTPFSSFSLSWTDHVGITSLSCFPPHRFITPVVFCCTKWMPCPR